MRAEGPGRQTTELIQHSLSALSLRAQGCTPACQASCGTCYFTLEVAPCFRPHVTKPSLASTNTSSSSPFLSPVPALGSHPGLRPLIQASPPEAQLPLLPGLHTHRSRPSRTASAYFPELPPATQTHTQGPPHLTSTKASGSGLLSSSVPALALQAPPTGSAQPSRTLSWPVPPSPSSLQL